MSDEIKLVIKLLEEQDEKRNIQLMAIQKNMEVGFDLVAAEVRGVKEQKIKQNGRIYKIEKFTRLNKFVNHNPKLSIFLGIILYYGLNEIINLISIADVIKKYLP